MSDDFREAGMNPRLVAQVAAEVRAENRSRNSGVGRHRAAESRLILSSRDFVAGFTPPDYLMDGLLQRRFIYSMTGSTGAGKTAVALLLASHLSRGEMLSGRAVEKGRCIYFSGENPDDVRMRWIGMGHHHKFDTDATDVHFIAGAYPLKEIKDRVRLEIEQIGPASLIVVDTAPAYSDARDENDNQQVAFYARSLRSMTAMPGGPTILVLAHPVKNAGPENLLPRGGGAFVAEMDGNLTATKDDTMTRLHWQGKFRGPDFEPITFELIEVRPPNLVDSKGRTIPTVVANAIGAQEELRREDIARSDEEQLLRAIRDNPRASFTTLIREMGWPTTSKSKVCRVMFRLEKDRFVKKSRGRWRLTDVGKREVEAAETPT